LPEALRVARQTGHQSRCDFIALYLPGLRPRLGIIAIIVALVGALKFTGWYPERVKDRATV
jgi:hypothetical protein